MFYINLALNGMFTGNQHMVETYWTKLQNLVVSETHGKETNYNFPNHVLFHELKEL